MTTKKKWLGNNVSDEFKQDCYQWGIENFQASLGWKSPQAEGLAQIGIDAYETFAYGAAFGADIEELKWICRGAAAAFAAAFEANDPLEPASEVQVEQTTFPVRPGGRPPTAFNWRDGFFLALIVGADDLLDRLCAADSRIPRPGQWAYDHYHVSFARALRLLWLGDIDAAGELLVEAIRDADPERPDIIAEPASVAHLAVPTMGVVAELAVGDEEAFNQKMERAIEGHHRYFSKFNSNASAAFVSIPLWGLRAWATRRSMAVQVDSPYVPEPL